MKAEPTDPAGFAGVGARKWRWLARLCFPARRWIGALALVAATAAQWYLQASRTGISYITVPVNRGKVERVVRTAGSINPILKITVGSYVSGVMEDFTCDFNTVVKKDRLCAQIDPRPYSVIVEQDQATVANARAQL